MFLILHSSGAVIFGFNYICMNTMGEPIIQDSFGINDIEKYQNMLSLAVNSWIAGKAMGTIISGAMVKKFGLKNVLLMNESINLLSIGLIFLSWWFNSIYIFFISRIFNGLHSGGIGTCGSRLPIECWPKKQRGIAGCVYSIFLAISGFYASSVVTWFSKPFRHGYWVPIML